MVKIMKTDSRLEDYIAKRENSEERLKVANKAAARSAIDELLSYESRPSNAQRRHVLNCLLGAHLPTELAHELAGLEPA